MKYKLVGAPDVFGTISNTLFRDLVIKIFALKQFYLSSDECFAWSWILLSTK